MDLKARFYGLKTHRIMISKLRKVKISYIVMTCSLVQKKERREWFTGFGTASVILFLQNQSFEPHYLFGASLKE